MTPQLRKIVSFALLCVPLLMLFFALYVWIWPSYHSFATGASNLITTRMSPQTRLETMKRGGSWTSYVFTPEEGEVKLRHWNRTDTAHLIYLSIVIVPAVLLATPAPFVARLRLLAIAVPLMFVGHLLSLIILTRATYCLMQTPGTYSCLFALRVAYSSGQLVSGVLWVLLTWRHWFPGARGGEREPATR
jgi:hypothetical protein